MAKIPSEYKEILESGLFSAEWYLDQYRDIAAAGADPLEHYMTYGVSEGRDPGPDFSTSGYLARYGDVAAAGINPLLHYIRYGRREGRLTTAYAPPHLVKRAYRNFGEYLAHAALEPMMKAPFADVDYRCFAVMEKTAGWLCRKTGECKRPPLISVIMPVRDRASIVGDAIRSVLEQSYENFELIVVDDGSRDDSVSVVRSFADPRLRLLEGGGPAGVSAARNRGLGAARGELIAYLDSDNVWLPDYLAAMAGAFEALPDADAAYSGQYLYRGNEGEPFAVRFGSYNPALLRNRNYIDLNCLVHRKGVLTAAGGGFCEELRRWVDWELVLRISRAGRIYSVPILQSKYFIDKADNTVTALEELEPARAYIMARHGYGSQAGTEGRGHDLIRKVAIVVPGHDSPEDRMACTDTLAINELNEAVRAADPESDILIADPSASLSPGALSALQQAAYADDSIAVAAPQEVLAAGEQVIGTHVPYAFNDAPCDVTLSQYHRNIESLPLFHAGGPVDLNYAPFFCVYVKRDAWEQCGGLEARQGGEHQADRVMCEFIRHVLGKRIVYTPDAVVFNTKGLIR